MKIADLPLGSVQTTLARLDKAAAKGRGIVLEALSVRELRWYIYALQQTVLKQEQEPGEESPWRSRLTALKSLLL